MSDEELRACFLLWWLICCIYPAYLDGDWSASNLNLKFLEGCKTLFCFIMFQESTSFLLHVSVKQVFLVKLFVTGKTAFCHQIWNISHRILNSNVCCLCNIYFGNRYANSKSLKLLQQIGIWRSLLPTYTKSYINCTLT